MKRSCRILTTLALAICTVAASGQDIDLRLIAVTAPTGTGSTTVLPTSITGVIVGTTYELELWASDVGAVNTGVTSAYVDLGWNGGLATAMSIDHGSIYDVFPSGAIGPGAVVELGGSVLAVVGVQPEWARVAVIEIQATDLGTVEYTPAPGAIGVAAYGRGAVPWQDVTLASATVEHVSGGPDLDLRLVALATPSASDYTTVLPASLVTSAVGSTYHVELWASDVGWLNSGVTSVYVDMTWTDSLASVASLDHGTIFTVFPAGTVAGASIDELGGSTLDSVGIEPEWVRVATVELAAEATGPITYALSPGSTGMAAFGRGQIAWDQVSLDQITVEQINDCNNNGIADEQDILDGTSADCNGNGVPDSCDIAGGGSTDINANDVPDECEGQGDLNCDGAANFDDIEPFVLALVGQQAYEGLHPGCRWLNADCNADGQVSFDDIDRFVQLLAGG